MQPCAFANAITGGALLLAAAFAGCGGAETPAESPDEVAPASDTTTAAAVEEPAADTPIEEGGDEAPADDEGGDEGGDDEAGDGDEGATPPPGTKKRDPAKVQEVVLAHRKPVRKCYEDAWRESKGIKGTLTITLTIRPDGTVKSAVLNKDRSDIVTPKVVDCAIAVLSKLDFGKHPAGMESTVNYPFDFKPPQ